MKYEGSTPGPWRMGVGGVIEGPNLTPNADYAHRPLIAEVYVHRPGSADRVPDDRTQLRNAILIEDAPRLAAMLEKVAGDLALDADSGLIPPDQRLRFDRYVRDIRAVLTAASNKRTTT